MYPTQLANMSFDEILDLTADAFKFYKYTYTYSICLDIVWPQAFASVG